MSPLPQLLMLTLGAEAALPVIAAIMKPEVAKCRVEVPIEGIDRSVSLPRLTRDRHAELTVHLSAVTLEPVMKFSTLSYPSGEPYDQCSPFLQVLAGSTHLDE